MKKIISFFLCFVFFISYVNADTFYEINDTDEFIKTIDKIYQSDVIDNYIITYSEDVYKNLDQEYILNYYKKNYMIDMNKNMYKYDEYGIVPRTRTNITIGTTETVIDNNTRKITNDEIKKVEKYIDEFLKPLEGLSDYEKIYNVYEYFSKLKLEYEEGTYTKSVEAYISVYDVIFEKKSTCIGAATAFQYFMEKLNIDSYIVDHLYIVENGWYTTHTYNIVKLNDKWYSVDSYFDGGGLLKKIPENKYYYNDLKFSNTDYDLKEVEYVLDKKEYKLENGNMVKTNDVETFIFVLILMILFLIIRLFTLRKEKK